MRRPLHRTLTLAFALFAAPVGGCAHTSSHRDVAEAPPPPRPTLAQELAAQGPTLARDPAPPPVTPGR